jgi:hypothetical protein
MVRGVLAMGCCSKLPPTFEQCATTPMNAMRAFRLTAPQAAETDLQASVADFLALALGDRVEWTAFPAGSVPLPVEYAAKLSRMGLQRGWPDLILVWDSRIYGIELKKPGSPLSKTRLVRTKRGGMRELIGQTARFERLSRQGMRIAICHDVPEVMAALKGWGFPLRGVS